MMTFIQRRLLVLLSLPCILQLGCATIFPEGVDRVPIDIPHTAKVFDTQNHELQIDSSEGDRALFLRYPKDDTLRILYNDTSYNLMPSRGMRLVVFADYLLSIGIGGFIDDITNNSLRYTSVTFDTNTARHESDLLSKHYSRSFADRFFGIAEASAPGLYVHGPYLLDFATSLGIGVGYHLTDEQRIELHATLEWLPDIDPLNTVNGTDFLGEMATRSIKLRLYPYKGIFVSGGFGSVRATSYDFNAIIYGANHTFLGTYPVQGGNSTFDEMQFGIGYSGDWTFIEYERDYGLPKHVRFGSQSIDFAIWVFRIGVSFRFP